MATITAKSSATSGMTAAAAANEDQIRRRAYQLYEEHGREDGHDVEDWLQAEAEINGKTKERQLNLSRSKHKPRRCSEAFLNMARTQRKHLRSEQPSASSFSG